MCLFDELSHFYFLSQFKEPATKALGLYPLLDLEHLFIAWMMAKIRNDDLLSNQYHKILKEQEEQLKSTHLGSLFSFAQGNETPLPPHLVLLGDTLRSLCNKNRSSEKRYCLNVTSGLFLKNNEPSTLAPPARRAIELLSISSTISARDFAAIVFGIKQYEPYRHDSKLRALLTKLSTLTKPDFHFGLRESYVYGKGNWAQLEIKKNVHPFLTPSYFSEWRHFILRPLEFIPNLSSFSLPKYFSREIPREMTRTQIERLTNKSRATANRMISDWEKKGMVIRSGRSRNTRYKLSETLRDQLKNSDSI